MEDEGKKELCLYNCAQCQYTSWGTIQLANHMLRAHGVPPLLAGHLLHNTAAGGKGEGVK